MSRATRRVVAVLVAVAVLAGAGVVIAVITRHNRRSPGVSAPLGQSVPSLPTAASPQELTASQQATLREIAGRTWAYLSGLGLDPTTHLPKNNVRTDVSSTAGDFTSPTEIGLYLASIVAARDLGIVTPAQALDAAAAIVKTIDHLATYRGFLLRWYSTASAQAIVGPSKSPLVGGGTVSSVDDSWFAQGVAVAEAAFPELSADLGRILAGMNFSLLYDTAKGVLYNSYTDGKGPAKATYDLAYGGPRIADYMAIGTKTVPGALWWTVNRTPPPGNTQRQTPVGQNATYVDPQTGHAYTVFEGHYTYMGIDFVPTFGGSMFQALTPDLVVPEQSFAPTSVGLNNVNTTIAQIAVARTLGLPVWGFAPATEPAHPARYAQYGAADLSTKAGNIPHDAVAPYASFLALPVMPASAFANIEALMNAYPGLYGPDGFHDSVDPLTGVVAPRYMAVSQAVILMAIDDALTGGKLQTYIGGSPIGSVLRSYLSPEHYSIQPATAPAVTSPSVSPLPAAGRPHRRRPRTSP